MSKFKVSRRAVTGGLIASPFITSRVSAAGTYDDGASDTEIKIGNIMPYSGPASAYGKIGKIEAAYFQMVNDGGGINGRKVNFISYDDGYSPPKAVEMARKLVEEDKVLLIYSPLGTPSNSAIQKYMNAKKVPQLFVATGASKFGDQAHFPWTMGWQPTYATEGAIFAKHILKTVKDPKIGILMQNDDFGKDYLTGFKSALGNDKLIVQLSTYEVTDPTIDSQMIQLKSSGADVFFNIATPKFAAQAIKKVAEIGWKPVHYMTNVSASFGAVFNPAGIEASQGIITGTYQKDVTDPKWKTADDYKAWSAFMAKYAPNADLKDQFNGYSYAVTSTMVQVLKQCGNELTRANIMKQAASLDFDCPMLTPGIKVKTSATDFYPITSLQLGRVEGNSIATFGEVMSKA